MIADAAAGRMPAYIDTGLNVVDVRDTAEGHLLACERGVAGERYILGAENLLVAQVDPLAAHLQRPLHQPVLAVEVDDPDAAVRPFGETCQSIAPQAIVR